VIRLLSPAFRATGRGELRAVCKCLEPPVPRSTIAATQVATRFAGNSYFTAETAVARRKPSRKRLRLMGNFPLSRGARAPRKQRNGAATPGGGCLRFQAPPERVVTGCAPQSSPGLHPSSTCAPRIADNDRPETRCRTVGIDSRIALLPNLSRPARLALSFPVTSICQSHGGTDSRPEQSRNARGQMIFCTLWPTT
jgi:hypothetical protein